MMTTLIAFFVGMFIGGFVMLIAASIAMAAKEYGNDED